MTFDRDMDASTFTAAQVLSVVGPTGAVPNTSTPYSVTAVGTRSFKITFAPQSASGIYAVTLASSLRSANHDALDTNQNAVLGEPVADQVTVSFQIFTTARPTRSRARAGRRSGRRRSATGASLNGYAGRVSSIAVDPSDPSGNTVYAAGASGGVWKTTNFLTTDPNGPTWIPLTDFGPTYGINIGSIAVFGPEQRPAPVDHHRRHRRGQLDLRHRRRHDARASASSARWTAGRPGPCSTARTITCRPPSAITSSPRPIRPGAGHRRHHRLQGRRRSAPDPQRERDHLRRPGRPQRRPLAERRHRQYLAEALGTTPPRGRSPPTWSSTSQRHRRRAQQPTGNVNTIYVAFQNAGTQVYSSPNRGQTLNPMTGSNFDAFIQDAETSSSTGSSPASRWPTAANPTGGGRVTLAKPALVPSTVPTPTSRTRSTRAGSTPRSPTPAGTSPASS